MSDHQPDAAAILAAYQAWLKTSLLNAIRQRQAADEKDNKRQSK